jgi:translation initiation factor IF-3
MRISRKKRRLDTTKRYFANEHIRAPKIRAIDEQGVNLGVLPTYEAIRMARERGFDVVMIDPKSNPPVGKFLHLGHFKYQKEKESRKARAQSKATAIKGVRLTARIAQHDMDVRLQQALKFLERGDKVQAEIIMHGRDKAHPDLMAEKLKEFIEKLKITTDIRIEQPITRQGTKFITLIAKS